MTDNTDLVTAPQESQSQTIFVLELQEHSEHKPHIVYIGTRLILINLQDIQYMRYTISPLEFAEVGLWKHPNQKDPFPFIQVSPLQSMWACNAPFAGLR